jgi:hypothetical protein
MSVSGGPDLIQDGLVLCLDAANTKSYPGSGTSWVDLSGNGNNGTLTNGPTFSSANSGSVLLDGANDYIACGNFSTLNNMSIGMWVRVLSNAGNYKAFAGAVGAGTDWGTGFAIHMSQNGRASFDTCCFEGGILYVGGGTNFMTTSVPFGDWANIYFTISANYIQFYLNGSAQFGTARLNNSTSTIGMNSLVIGSRPDAVASRGANANIASAIIHNRALSASEVFQNYNATKGRFRL